MKDSAISPKQYYAEYFKPADHGFVRVEPIQRLWSGAREMSPRTTGSFELPGDIDDLVTEIARQEAKHLEMGHKASIGVYSTGLVHREKVGGEGRTVGTDAIGLTALTLDIDCAYGIHKTADEELPATDEEALSLIEAFSLPPSAVMRSGGGLYATWFLDEMVPVHDGQKPPVLEMFHATMQRIFDDADKHLDNTSGLTQIYRCPGTTNTKGGRSVRSEVISLTPENRYSVGDIFDACDAWRPPAPSLPEYDGPKRPGDAFNAEATTEDVQRMLVERGFHSPSEVKSGRIDMVRPSEDPRHRPAISIFRPDRTSGGIAYAYVWSLASEISELGLDGWQRGYSPFELKARFEFGGDYSKCAVALAHEGYGDGGTGEVNIDHLQPIDFRTLRDEIAERPRWWVEPMLAYSRGHSLDAEGGGGKSLSLLEVAASKATGRAILDQPAGEPEHVVYIDQEMGKDDLAERLSDMGFDYWSDETLQEHLHYYQLIGIRPFDTERGAKELLAVIDRHNATGLIIDTFIRVVEGDENAANTVGTFARLVGIPLKARNVTWVRADHLGKDKSKDARGSSAKRDDVDVVWQLSVKEKNDLEPDIVTLTERKRRMPWIPKRIVIERYSFPNLHHQIKKIPLDEKGKKVVNTLREAEFPTDSSNTKAIKFLRDEGYSFTNAWIAPVLEHWRLEVRTRGVSDE